MINTHLYTHIYEEETLNARGGGGGGGEIDRPSNLQSLTMRCPTPAGPVTDGGARAEGGRKRAEGEVVK